MFGPTSVNGRFLLLLGLFFGGPALTQAMEDSQYHCRGIAFLPCRSCSSISLREGSRHAQRDLAFLQSCYIHVCCCSAFVPCPRIFRSGYPQTPWHVTTRHASQRWLLWSISVEQSVAIRLWSLFAFDVLCPIVYVQAISLRNGGGGV